MGRTIFPTLQIPHLVHGDLKDDSSASKAFATIKRFGKVSDLHLSLGKMLELKFGNPLRQKVKWTSFQCQNLLTFGVRDFGDRPLLGPSTHFQTLI